MDRMWLVIIFGLCTSFCSAAVDEKEVAISGSSSSEYDAMDDWDTSLPSNSTADMQPLASQRNMGVTTSGSAEEPDASESLELGLRSRTCHKDKCCKNKSCARTKACKRRSHCMKFCSKHCAATVPGCFNNECWCRPV